MYEENIIELSEILTKKTIDGTLDEAVHSIVINKNLINSINDLIDVINKQS